MERQACRPLEINAAGPQQRDAKPILPVPRPPSHWVAHQGSIERIVGNGQSFGVHVRGDACLMDFCRDLDDIPRAVDAGHRDGHEPLRLRDDVVPLMPRLCRTSWVLTDHHTVALHVGVATLGSRKLHHPQGRDRALSGTET